MELMKKAALSAAPFFFSSEAAAQDRCTDVLMNGTMQNSRFQQSDYFKQIIWSRFLKSTYQSSKTDRSGGLTVPIGEIVLGADYSEEQYNAKKLQIQSEYFNDITSTREIDIALASGDPTIIGAWSHCMTRSGGGMSVRFEPLSDTTAFMITEYRSQGRNHKNRLVGNVEFPAGVRVSDPARCLRRGATIEAGLECRVTLTMSSATQRFAVTVAGGESVAQAWLPARLKLVPEVKPYLFLEKDHLYVRGHKQVLQPGTSVSLSEDEIKAGWLFDPASAQTNLQTIYLNKADCDSVFNRPTAFNFTFGYRLYAPNRRRDGKDGLAICTMSPFILMRRDTWVAAGEVSTVKSAF